MFKIELYFVYTKIIKLKYIVESKKLKLNIGSYIYNYINKSNIK